MYAIESGCHETRKHLPNTKYCYVPPSAHNWPVPEIDDSTRCPCGTGLTYGGCCGPFLKATAQPPTAERMMRSRYTAYVARHPGYLLATWHPSTRPPTLVLDADTQWLGLEILGRTRGGMLDNEGTVEFRQRTGAMGCACTSRRTAASFARPRPGITWTGLSRSEAFRVRSRQLRSALARFADLAR